MGVLDALLGEVALVTSYKLLREFTRTFRPHAQEHLDVLNSAFLRFLPSANCILGLREQGRLVLVGRTLAASVKRSNLVVVSCAIRILPACRRRGRHECGRIGKLFVGALFGRSVEKV